ncbi:ADP-ribose pyrophosphatase [Paramagnetospirillum kuznetsovii]|uniref:ADP-ribose pyrophosphatase n=1 Tax=Paramagnetospirillum kuznetsovii TaxID=2053833 RepID=A0A364NV70_9PROT|nr:NUDIX hydrolase [Paramagnetospirillum kuznetsovii]RAU20981.1 ADP-ribose pyrophosphatase [Paramagnetospirillum kuznetsovii]
MPRQYPSHPLPGVLALMTRDDRILMVLRGKEPDKGKWGFPGGLVELGETVLAAALRELHEETGLIAEAEAVMDVFEVITPDEDGRIRYHFVLNVVRCHWQSGEAVAADDAAQVGWFSLADIADPLLPCSSNVGRLARMALAQTKTAD